MARRGLRREGRIACVATGDAACNLMAGGAEEALTGFGRHGGGSNQDERGRHQALTMKQRHNSSLLQPPSLARQSDGAEPEGNGQQIGIESGRKACPGQMRPMLLSRLIRQAPGRDTAAQRLHLTRWGRLNDMMPSFQVRPNHAVVAGCGQPDIF